jgi:dienelactone hydrolase
MERGIAALCIEQRSFGERGETKIPANFDYLCHQAVVHALMLGRTLIGERVFDVDRGIDYLESRGDVDMDRLGVMGNSGGGTVTMFASLLPRLKLAMPSCCFSTFRQSLMSVFHCMCNFIPGLYPLADMADVVGLYAPRPVVVVAGKEDGIFPLSGARSEFARLKKIYEGLGAGDRCHLVEGNGGHRFYADDAWPVMKKMM